MSEMQIVWHLPEVIAKVSKNIDKGLTRAGVFISDKAKQSMHEKGPSTPGDPPGVGVGALRSNVGWEIRDEGSAKLLLVGVKNSPAAKYARIQEYGGVIEPTSAKYLTIPLTDEARKKPPRQWNDLTVIKSDRGNLILAQVPREGQGAGVEGGIIPQFVLTKRVVLPPRPYIRPAVYNNRVAIAGEICKGGRAT